MTTFVDGWDFIQTLGEGAYGEVKLAVNRSSGDAVAVKIIEILDDDRLEQVIRKEIAVHRNLCHDNIIRYYGHRKGGPRAYIFLEYAQGGELFDRIEPDKGLQHSVAQKFFRELITGVEYLHSRGVVHRDLKPENLLIDSNDCLKISDFGLATVFRFQGRERELETCCGTKPYVAPEVLKKKYKGQPIDIWSCGIILVAMLAGELPWDEPTPNCFEYCRWKDRRITVSPWKKIDTLSLNLLGKILKENPSQRATIESIKAHRWYLKDFVEGDENELSLTPATKKLCMESKPMKISEDSCLPVSQPEPRGTVRIGNAYLCVDDLANFTSFSQPTNSEHLVLSQIPSTPSSQGHCMVKRMTRFFSISSYEKTFHDVVRALEQCRCTVKKSALEILTGTTSDKRGNPLVIKVNIISMIDIILVDFRLSKGDGLEFKRKFLKVKELVKDIVSKRVPDPWGIPLPPPQREPQTEEKEPENLENIAPLICEANGAEKELAPAV